jgi:ribulose-5-phosphate 4-epimerase/fuculose-1-phosphate aldolase
MLETMCDIMDAAYKTNWITSRDGNMSVRHQDRDHFYITPSGVRKQTLQPDQFKKMAVTPNGPEYLPYTDISANLVASGELPMHYGLIKNIPEGEDTRVVVHVHPTYCVAAMHAGINLCDIDRDFPELNRYSNIGPNVGDVPPISQELADNVHENMGLKADGTTKCNIVGIKGHGVVAIDTTPWRAYEHVERLEHICKIILVSGKLGLDADWVKSF